MNAIATTIPTPIDRDISEKPAHVVLHWSIGLGLMLLTAVIGWMAGSSIKHSMELGYGIPSGGIVKLGIALILFAWIGNRFIMIEPFQALVISRFGRYIGVDRREGLGWVIPFHGRHIVSTALQNFETATVKVNDRSGSPIDIGVVVVTRINDPAKATYIVEDVKRFVSQQVVASLRTVAASHDYDGTESKAAQEAAAETSLDGKSHKTIYTLRGDLTEIAEELRRTAQEGLGDIGVEIREVRITHLAYSPEIAAAMLKRQQAQAIVAARETIVKGAVAIVEDTMNMLSEKGMGIDEDRRAVLISNLLVVLSSDREAAPVLPVAA